MIQKLWNCFEQTGAISTYLNFKDYESSYQETIMRLTDLKD